MLQENCREHDLVARYGGEEFVMLLPATEFVGARLVCERMRMMIERHCWACRPITASFGVATLGVAAHGPAQLIDEADQALYHSKRRGRNRVTHYQDLMAAFV
jgi:diguanylate cyclase (GGDEF)-like protein